MQRTLTLAVVAFVAMLVMGCTQPTNPLPDPVQVYLEDGMAFTNVDETSDTFVNTSSAGVYRIDGTGDYLLNGKVVTYDKSVSDCFTISIDGKTYLNDINMKSWTWTSETITIDDVDAGVTDLTDPAVDYTGIVHVTYNGTDYPFSLVTYNGDGTITFMGQIFN